MNSKYYQICKDYNYSHAGNISAEKILNLIDRTHQINRILKGKKREKVVMVDFLHQEDKNMYEENDEKDDFCEDIFDKNYKNHYQQLLDEQKSKYFNLQKSCSNLNSRNDKNHKDLNTFNQEKFKYHLIHHVHDLNCDETIYKNIGNETSGASYNPKFDAIYKKIIISPKFGKMSGRYDMEKIREIFEKKKDYNLQKKREQLQIEKMQKIKKIKKIFKTPEKKIEKNSKTNYNNAYINLFPSKRHKSYIGVKFKNNILNSCNDNNINNKSLKKSYSLKVDTLKRASIKEKSETENENEIIEEEDDLDSCRQTGDFMKELYSKSNTNANNSCTNINNGYYNELSTTNPRSSIPNLDLGMKNSKNTDLSYTNINSINNNDTIGEHDNISINYMQKQKYNNNKNKNKHDNFSRNNFRQNLYYNKSNNSNNNNSSIIYNYKNKSCSSINNNNRSSKKRNILPRITPKNVINFNKMLSREYVDKVKSPPNKKIYTYITPNYDAIRPREIMKVIYSRKPYYKNKKNDFKSDFNEAIFDINKYYNNYNNHFPPKNIYFDKMTGKEISNNSPLPSYMLKQFNRNTINSINEKTLLMNNFANGQLTQNKSSFNEKKSFNFRLNEQYYKDNLQNNNNDLYQKIINNTVRNEKRKMMISHSMCDLDSNGKKRWKIFSRLRDTPEYYKIDLDDLGKYKGRVDGITFKVDRSNVNVNELLTDSEKNIFLPDLK